MAFLDFLSSKNKAKIEDLQSQLNAVKKHNPSASGTWSNSYVMSYDGEKNQGEMGPIIQYELFYHGLRLRSWQSYLESDIAKTVLNKFSLWIVDKGLKLQSAPAKNVLTSEGIDIDTEKFNEITEARFNVWSKSKHSSHNGMGSLKTIAKEAFKNAKIGGDVLVILRFKKNKLSVQLVDGAHVSSPFAPNKEMNGNKIVDGIEIDKNGKHVAYHIKTSPMKHERVEAWSKSTGFRTAFLVYGSKYRIDNMRGVPIISTSLETLKKIERYKEAAVGSAEERQKIAYSIEHGMSSTGESPLVDSIAAMTNADAPSGLNGIPVDEQGVKLAAAITATTNKQAFNMPIDSKLNVLESKNEMFFKEFYGTNADIVCSGVGIPPNVAFSIYNDSFSASRAATKDWEHTIDFERDDFQEQFYNPIYQLWLHMEILNQKIQAPGYLVAFNNDDFMVVESYQCARFTGPKFPHIDPLKEAKAEREKLGAAGAHLPLTTQEAATEQLQEGDSTSNTEQFAKELNRAEDLEIEIQPKTEEPIVPTEGEDS